MAKIRTINKVNWGGWNPFIKNYIEIESKEINRTENEIIFHIKDVVIGEQSYLGENNETLINEYPLRTVRDVFFPVNMELYNDLYHAIDELLPNSLTPFEKDKIREEEAFLYFFKNDKILDENNNQFCLYGTQPNEWEVKR